MALALTPINDAWSNMSKIKREKKTKPVSPQPNNNNMYSNPEIQNKILRELNLIESYSEPETELVSVPTQMPSLQFKNKDLQEYFKPYSGDYIESIILNTLRNSNKSNTDLNHLSETLDNIYIIVLAVLILTVFDIALRYKR